MKQVKNIKRGITITVLLAFLISYSFADEPVHFQFSNHGGDYHGISFNRISLFGGPLSPGDEIGAFCDTLGNGNLEDFICIGAVAYPFQFGNQMIALVDDEFSTVQDGFSYADSIYLKIWDSSTDSEMDIGNITFLDLGGAYDPSGQYNTNTVSLVDISVGLPIHFSFNETGTIEDGFETFFINSAFLLGLPLDADDEIGIFDGDLCVGAVPYLDETDQPAYAWEGGFTEGNPITFKVYDSSADTETEMSVLYTEFEHWDTSGLFSSGYWHCENGLYDTQASCESHFFEWIMSPAESGVTLMDNFPPIADAGIDVDVDEGILYQLDGSGSYDPDGGILTYLWTGDFDFDDSTSIDPRFETPEVTENTEFVVTLEVTDGELTASDEIIITVVDTDIYGCMNELACNYDDTATVDNGSCWYAEEYYDCDGTCINDVDADGVCDELEIAGCMDAVACNYNELATDDDGSCYFEETVICYEDVDGDGYYNATQDYTECDAVCSDLGEAWSNSEGSGAEETGCTDELACNFVETATVDNGSCWYAEEYYDCDGTCINDVDADGVCDELEIAGCMDAVACNYNELATDDDGSCYFEETVICYEDVDGDGYYNATQDYTECDAVCSDLGEAWSNSEGSGAEETGCTDELACNFVETATEDDGSCYSENTVTCYEDVDADGYYNQTQDYTECDAVCLDLGEAWSDSEGSGVEIFGCDDPEANNYDETATENDGSCEYNTPPVAFDDAFETSEDVILTIEAPGVLGNDEDAEAGGSPDWVVDVPFYEFNATITSVVFFNDEESVDENDIVAAFVDDVCRGLASPTYFPVNGRYTVNMMIYSNLSTGETMTFKAYDSSANMVGIVDYSYDFIANENVGNDMVPNELHCTYEGEGQVLSTVLDTDVTNGNLTLSADGSFEYTPNADWFGTDSFTYTAFDGEFYSDPATVTITVTSVNDAPTIDLPESFTFDEDGSLTEDFTSYLFDIDEDILTLDVSDSEIISVVIDGFTVTLEAAENWNGTETITFIVDDSQGREIASDLVDIIVLPTNDAPTANEMFIATDEDTPVEITLSGYDIDGDDLTFTVVDAPINGTYEGGIYTPNANYFGEDTFTFVANDTELDSDPATVSITIAPINDVPSDFVLLTPEDNTEILITEENLDVVLEFSWEASTDQDDDELTYTFIGYGDLEMLAFGSTTETSFSVTYGELEDLMYLQGLEVITGTWSILVTDGVENVEAIAFALTIDGSAVGIDGVIAPDNFALRQNHPNPFNPVTTISYDISEVSHVVLEVYNVMGQRVNTLVNGTVNVGYHQAQWDGRDDSARQLPSGVYLYHLTVNGITVDMKKMMMIK